MSDMISWDYAQNKGICYRVPVEKKHQGFIVKQGFEKALWIKNGVLYDTISGISYKFKKDEKEGSEIIYVKRGDIKINWGIPINNGIITVDGKSFGAHGDLIIKIVNPAEFVFNVVASVGQEFVESVEKELFIQGEKGKEKILRKKVAKDEIDIKDAKRALEPFLFTKSDLKNWLSNIVRSTIRNKLSKLTSTEFLKADISELEKELRLKNANTFASWGIEVKALSIIGWQMPNNLQW
ncbi:MAG: SPFH domain-containing protein [Candidatus Helarchaeota archaeon]